MKSFFKSFFGVSGKETNAFTVLFVVLVLVLAVPRLVALWPGPDELPVNDRQQLDSLLAILTTDIPANEPLLFGFNPNTISQDSLQLLGFDVRVAGRIVRYRQAGGRFYQPQDMLKIYGIDSQLVQQLLPFIETSGAKRPDTSENMIIASKVPASGSRGGLPNTTNRQPFDINRADTAMLQVVRGIGSVLSRRIVNYRSRLGGFVRPEQLYEVYHLDSAVIQKLLEISFIAADFEPQKLAVNRATASELAAHPYLSRQQARLIVAYRQQHGDFSSPADLRQVYGMDSLTLHNILPYLSWEPAK